MNCKNLLIFILISIPIFSQRIAEYNKLFQSFEKERYFYETYYILTECESFFEKYPLYDSLGSIIEYYVRTGWDSEILESNRAIILLLKASMVYNLNTKNQRSEDLFDEILADVNSGWNTLTPMQNRVLSKSFSEHTYDASIENRAFKYIETLFDLSDENLAKDLIPEIKWYIDIFKVSNKIDSARFWLGKLYSLNGDHLLAAGNFLAIANLDIQGSLSKTATLLAADELVKSPNWEFAKAASVLIWYLETFPQSDWKPALEKLTRISLIELEQIEKSSEYCKSLMNLFPDTFDLDSEVMEELFERFKSDNQKKYALEIGKAYVSKYPDESYADEVQEFILKSESQLKSLE